MKRKAVISLGAVVVAAGALVVAVQLAPGGAKTTTAADPAPTQLPPVETPVILRDNSKPPAEPGQAFDAWASKTSTWLDIPLRPMESYAKATLAMAKEKPDCHLSWVTLAAVGKTTTDHGRALEAQFDQAGTPSKPIGNVQFKDFYGRVVSSPDANGPLQLPSAIWDKWQASASGKTPDVQNIDDVVLTAARALCGDGRDLLKGDVWWKAVSTLHSAPLMLHRTLATLNVYGTVGQRSDAPNPAVLGAVNFAISKIGLPYVWGGNGKGGSDPGFDCSGLTTAAYGSAGVKLMRTADTQFRSVKAVSEPQLGDLIFYGEPKTKIHHVGLYIGNQQMIDAPTEGQAVQVHTYRKQGDDYAGAGRPVA
ncbi:NlpC/P60 family protein [Amycolatopsis xylanica]|uniref:NlpC/P60 family protein n=1 Tax=Amycolatopsis xylanica TaxID=589385 RepID=A0A1H3QSV9_9PSEU|nr:NlpC/P60 family protein [Amycolatopsis xylanica]